jgi:glyoxylase-like metal-dependent hydrolase (beta-lactamase superfamily II)
MSFQSINHFLITPLRCANNNQSVSPLRFICALRHDCPEERNSSHLMRHKFPSPCHLASKLCQAKDMATSLGTLHYFDHNLDVHRVVVGPYANNVFVIRCKHTGDAVLIDAANEHERLLDLCQALGVRRVLETHGHHDHIQAVPAMREAGYEVAVAPDDAGMLKDVGYDVFINDEDVIEVGRLRLDVIHNPGHTPGSISFKVQNAPLLFTGDTLFPGGPGATHFPGGSFDTIIQSIDSRLFTFPGNTVVLPGHGVDTTISVERPHLDEWVKRGW